MAEGLTYLAVAYLGMLIAIGIWTWTVLREATISNNEFTQLNNTFVDDKNEEE